MVGASFIVLNSKKHVRMTLWFHLQMRKARPRRFRTLLKSHLHSGHSQALSGLPSSWSPASPTTRWPSNSLVERPVSRDHSALKCRYFPWTDEMTQSLLREGRFPSVSMFKGCASSRWIGWAGLSHLVRCQWMATTFEAFGNTSWGSGLSCQRPLYKHTLVQQ